MATKKPVATEAESPLVLAAMPSPQRLLPVNDVLYTVETDVAGTRARLVVDTGAINGMKNGGKWLGYL